MFSSIAPQYLRQLHSIHNSLRMSAIIFLSEYENLEVVFIDMSFEICRVGKLALHWKLYYASS